MTLKELSTRKWYLPMYELKPGRKQPELSLSSFEARGDVLNILRFRLKCRNEGKTGVVMLGFGQAFWVDEQGNYMDGAIPPAELELASVLKELGEQIVPGTAPN